jgi:hypothetical protein
MSPAEIDPESRCRVPLPRREDPDAEGETHPLPSLSTRQTADDHRPAVKSGVRR